MQVEEELSLAVYSEVSQKSVQKGPQKPSRPAPVRRRVILVSAVPGKRLSSLLKISQGLHCSAPLCALHQS